MTPKIKIPRSGGFFMRAHLTYASPRGIIYGMKNMFLSLLVLVGMMLGASANAYVDRGAANVRIMNKAAGKTQSVKIPVGTNVNFEKLDVMVRACKQTDPFEAEDYFAFIEITKSGDGLIYSGWMSRNEPGDNPLQNADYDLWLVGCDIDGGEK